MRLIELILSPEQENGVYALSLVDMPAIEENFMFFNKEENPFKLRFDEEKHLIIGPVLIPGKQMWRTAESLKQNEGALVFASEETVVKCAQKFIANLKSQNLTLMHEIPTSGAKVVESWLVEDPTCDKAVALGFKNLVKNEWFASVYVEDPKIWTMIKAKKLRGFSVESLFGLGTPKEVPDSENPELMEMMAFLEQFAKCEQCGVEMEFPMDQSYEVGKPMADGVHHVVNIKHAKLPFAKIEVHNGMITNVGETKSILDLEKGGPEQQNDEMHRDTTEGEQQGVNPMLKCK